MKQIVKKYKIIFSIIILTLITGLCFIYSMEIRRGWLGELSTGDSKWRGGHHQWLSGSTLKFVNNWYFEGPLKLKFAFIENPKSVEFKNLTERKFYPSYPPGTIIPLYLLTKLLNHELTPSILMKYNLINQFFIAFFLSLSIFFFLRQININTTNSTLLSVIPIIIEYYTPATMYWHQNVFFSDQAVIFPFVLFIFLEIIKSSIKNKRIIYILQTIISFYGSLTDWFFTFVILVIWFINILKNKKNIIKTTLYYWTPYITAIGLFLIQLGILGLLNKLYLKFLMRTGISQKGAKDIHDFFDQFWIQNIQNNYGTLYFYFIIGSIFFLFFLLIFMKFKKDKFFSKILIFISYFIFPPLLQVYFLKNHSVVHDFSVLKFSPALATIPFVIIPIIIIYLFKIKHSTFYNIKLHKATFILPIIFCITILHSTEYYTKLFPKPDLDLSKIGYFIKNNSSYKDIIFSDIYIIPENPPQRLSYSMKRIYKANNLKDICKKIKSIKNNFIINFFTKQYKQNSNFIKTINNNSFKKIKNNQFILYKIKKQKIIQECKKSVIKLP